MGRRGRQLEEDLLDGTDVIGLCFHFSSSIRTVGDGAVVCLFIEAIAGKGVGNACPVWLDQVVGHGVVEALPRRISISILVSAVPAVAEQVSYRAGQSLVALC